MRLRFMFQKKGDIGRETLMLLQRLRHPEYADPSEGDAHKEAVAKLVAHQRKPAPGLSTYFLAILISPVPSVMQKAVSRFQ